MPGSRAVPQAFAEAVAAYNNGQLPEAERLFGAIVDADSGHFDAANLLAIVQFLRGFPAEALASFDKALAIRPDDVEALIHRGAALQALGRFTAALASYDQALAIRPDVAEAHNRRGAVLQALGRRDEALASYDRAVAADPGLAPAHNNRGTVLMDLGRPAEALASYERALALRSDYVLAHNNRGNALKALDRFEEALASYDRALALRAEYPEALNNRGNALMKLNRPDEALTSYDRALALRGGYAEAFNNRGNALLSLGRPREALASYGQALALRADNAEALHNRARALMTLDRSDEALASYELALAVNPGYADARLGRSMALLLRGDYVRGWRDYESRWDTASMRPGRRNFAQPLWLGDADLAGSTILLHSEQGFGDTIQFCRFATAVARRGARVVLEVQPELKALVASLDPAVRVIAAGDALPAFDRHCPLMSLPLALGLALENIPAAPAYLRAPADKMQAWRERLGAATKPRVGLVWAGNPRLGMIDANRIDRQRSLAFAQFGPLFDAADCRFVSLQKGAAAAAQLRQSRYGDRVADWTDELADFTDTAALIANLDLVITVDTAVAHLVGALGKPLWLLNRSNTCWRWLRDRDDSPWYPTARIFRQPDYGDWGAVIERVAGELRRWGG